MAQSTLLKLSFLLAAAFILAPTYTKAKCNLCTDYGIACVNETAFNMCFGGKPDTSNVYSCPPGKVCSATSLKCANVSGSAQPACEPNKGCGICDGFKLFACTSRTTFAQCNPDKTLSQKNINCPKGLTCSTQSIEICVNECERPTTSECDRETPL
ncbi:uncharacterized protein LOC119609758 [Lucilia sericata]|uniref:uncharacterized protein LOC119609758 n=1 Tax=Lucilia sericata TaxID=13632 RepID=UPI0018A7FAA1|nr:uncharacterized protein LOC119609758 [Lucilia sericata]